MQLRLFDDDDFVHEVACMATTLGIDCSLAKDMYASVGWDAAVEHTLDIYLEHVADCANNIDDGAHAL